MTTYLLPKARNTVTGQTIKTQDLTGTRFGLNQRGLHRTWLIKQLPKCQLELDKVGRVLWKNINLLFATTVDSGGD